MVRVQIFSHNSAAQLQDNINNFIKDKTIIDIKYSPFILPTSYNNGVPTSIDIVDRVLIMYEEE